MILPSQLRLSSKQLAAPGTAAAGRGAHSTPHAVKGATAAPAITADKGQRPRRSTGTPGKMESFDLKPTKFNSPSSHNEIAAIPWGPLGPIHPSKPAPSKKLSRKSSNPLPSAGGGSTSHTTTMDRTFLRRPTSKESTASSQRTAVSHAGTAINPTTTNSTLTNSTTNPSSTNAPVLNLLPSTASPESMARPFTMRHNRKYLSDPASYYPLPFTLTEQHRQVLRTMLLVSVFGSPLCSPLWSPPSPPPKKILEVGCGNGYWSALCHKHFARLGHTVEFTGIDIAPLAQDMRAEGMKWRFVQHDLREVPIPFQNDEFDIIMVKDLALISSALNLTANLMEEYFRCLKPGGQMEVWDSDSCIRLLAPHSQSSEDALSVDSGLTENDDLAQADGTGTYVITPQTPFKDAQNPYLLEYNDWITVALTRRGFTTMPCTLMGPLLAQELQLGEVQSRRIAIPFSSMRWEREDESENGRLMNREEGKRVLSESQKALRETALLQFTMWIDSMEPFLKDAAEKNQEEWDRWYSDMMASLFEQQGTAAGECLEIGAWWATKKGTLKMKKGNSAIADARRRKEKKEGGEGGEDIPSPWPKEPHPGKMWEFPGPEGPLL